MISIRKYLDRDVIVDDVKASEEKPRRKPGDPMTVALEAYRRLVQAIGRSGVDACPATGQNLEKNLSVAMQELGRKSPVDGLTAAGGKIDSELHEWGRLTARHYQQKAGEVKEILLAMARTAESVGDRDQRCARQISDVTTQLRSIANLEDISQMRRSIHKSASDLKTSIDRMTAEGKAVMDALQTKVATFQAKLEEAEQAASCDALTRLRNRLWMEGQLEERIAAQKPFCVAILDIDGFKGVNDTYGHVVGDEVLKQFAVELRLSCRSTDLVGRWGGDEFIVLLDTDMTQSQAQIDRVKAWTCGNYSVEGASGTVKLRVDASIGLAQFTPPETLKELLDRADSEMYRGKRQAVGSRE